MLQMAEFHCFLRLSNSLLWAFQVALVVKNLPANAGDKRCGFNPWVKKILWRRVWQPNPTNPTPVFLPGESHGQRSLVVPNPWGTAHEVTNCWTPLRRLSIAKHSNSQSIVYTYHTFFIHSFINGHLGCFYILATVNSTTTNIGVSFQISVPVASRYTAEVELPRVVLFLVSWGTSICFPEWLHQFTFPLTV